MRLTQICTAACWYTFLYLYTTRPGQKSRTPEKPHVCAARAVAIRVHSLFAPPPKSRHHHRIVINTTYAQRAKHAAGHPFTIVSLFGKARHHATRPASQPDTTATPNLFGPGHGYYQLACWSSRATHTTTHARARPNWVWCGVFVYILNIYTHNSGSSAAILSYSKYASQQTCAHSDHHTRLAHTHRKCRKQGIIQYHTTIHNIYVYNFELLAMFEHSKFFFSGALNN